MRYVQYHLKMSSGQDNPRLYSPIVVSDPRPQEVRRRDAPSEELLDDEISFVALENYYLPEQEVREINENHGTLFWDKIWENEE